MKQEDSKREYARYIHELVCSDAKKLQFNLATDYEARQCLKCTRTCIERHDLDLTTYRVNTTVYVEKI